jgi:hypothetical protein
MSWTCSAHGNDEKDVKILVGKPEGRKLLGKTSRRSEDSFEVDAK